MQGRRHIRGFTLVELMVVIVIIAGVTLAGMRIYSRGVRGEKAPAFARAMLGLALEARHAFTRAATTDLEGGFTRATPTDAASEATERIVFL